MGVILTTYKSWDDTLSIPLYTLKKQGVLIIAQLFHLITSVVTVPFHELGAPAMAVFANQEMRRLKIVEKKLTQKPVLSRMK